LTRVPHPDKNDVPLLLLMEYSYFILQLAYETGFRNSIVIEVPSRELTGLLHMGPPCLALSGVVIDDVLA
jgi:hypothetical protein